MNKDFELYIKQKELREIYNIHVIVTIEGYKTGINYLVQVFEYEKNDNDCWSNNTTGMYGDNAEFKTYEEALEFGIELGYNILKQRKNMSLFEKVKFLLKDDIRFVLVLYNECRIGGFYYNEENKLYEYNNVFDTIDVENIPPCYTSLRNESFVNEYFNNEKLFSFKTFKSIEEFLHYLKENIEEEVNIRLKEADSNASKIYNSLKKDIGKIVNFMGNDVGILLCATSTDEDYYWVYMDENKKLHYSSCVGRYTIEEDINKFPNFLTLLNNKKEIINSIEKLQKEKLTDYIFTDLTYFYN